MRGEEKRSCGHSTYVTLHCYGDAPLTQFNVGDDMKKLIKLDIIRVLGVVNITILSSLGLPLPREKKKEGSPSASAVFC